MGWTVERARFTRCAIWPRLKPGVSSSSARRIAAARAMTCTWLRSLVSRLSIRLPSSRRAFALFRNLIHHARNAVQNNSWEASKPMVRKIALEEHFLCPGFEDYWSSTVEDVDAATRARLAGRLSDFGDERLAAMDKAGIERSVLSLTGPGVQIEGSVGTAVRRAREADDFLAY